MSETATIVFQCGCGRSLKAKTDYAGKQVKCPSCQQALTVPGQRRGQTLQGRSGTPANSLSRQPAVPTTNPIPAIQAPGGVVPPPVVQGGVDDMFFAPAPAPTFAPPPTAYPPTSHSGVPAPGVPGSGIPSPGVPGPYGQAPLPPSPASSYHGATTYPGVAPPMPGSPANAMANETCPGCGSFFPVSQQTCHKCRFDRAAGRKLPYQNMMQPAVKQAQPAYQMTPKKSSVFVDSPINWGLIGGGAGLLSLGFLVLVGGFMVGVVFLRLAIVMMVGGTIMLFKGIAGMQ